MANAILLGLPRLGLGTITIGPTEVSTMPKSNLETDEPSDVCRINSKDPLKTYIHSTLEMPNGYYGTSFDVGGVGVVNHTMSIGATSRTMFLDASAAGYIPERVLPNAVTLGTDWTGVVGSIDEDPYSVDGNSIDRTDATVGALTIKFATPSATPAVGADRQLMRLHLTWTTKFNNITVTLQEDGTPNPEGDLYSAVTGADPIPASGSVILMPWDADILATADGSKVEIGLQITGGTGVKVQACDWLCDSGLSAGSILWDSGWQDTSYDDVDAAYGSTVSGTTGAALTQTHLAWSNSGDISSVVSAVTLFRDPLNTAGYIDVGCYVVGPAFQPTLNRAYGELVGVMDLSVKKRTHGGQTFGVNRPRLRVVSLPLGELSTTEAHTLFERLYWRKGILSPVLVSLFPGDSVEEKHTTIWATLENAGDMGVKDESGWRQMAMTFVEKL